MSCGSPGGPRIGCRTPRSYSWGSGEVPAFGNRRIEEDVWLPPLGGREMNHAATLQEGRLRADGDEAPRDTQRSGVGERARDRGAVRHSRRADGESAAAA